MSDAVADVDGVSHMVDTVTPSVAGPSSWNEFAKVSEGLATKLSKPMTSFLQLSESEMVAVHREEEKKHACLAKRMQEIDGEG